MGLRKSQRQNLATFSFSFMAMFILCKVGSVCFLMLNKLMQVAQFCRTEEHKIIYYDRKHLDLGAK